jgi:hypothetical protein
MEDDAAGAVSARVLAARDRATTNATTPTRRPSASTIAPRIGPVRGFTTCASIGPGASGVSEGRTGAGACERCRGGCVCACGNAGGAEE